MTVEVVPPDPTEFTRRVAQAELLENAGINPYPAEPPVITHRTVDLINGYEDLQGSVVGIAGRMISKRVHGGITFAHFDDASGKIQAVMTKARLGDGYPLARDYYEEGDFLGVRGELQRTKTGEISIWADDLRLLTKALRAAPQEVKDPETQQRQRYLQTLIDPEARRRFRTRAEIVQYMRNYFINQLGCTEVETPVLDYTYGGAAARPFVTKHNALDTELFLRISNELYLKRLTVGGFYEGVFEFSRNFRNEGMDRTHNPEFTLLELYKPFWDYFNMMDMAEDLVSGMVGKIHGTTQVAYGDQTIDFKKPWRRLTVYEGIKQKAGIDPETATDKELEEAAHFVGVSGLTRGELVLGLFEQLWGEELIQPTFVMDYPAETSALTKRHRNNPELTERFEMYAGGMEIMNCYTELNDPRDQRQRFELEARKRGEGDQETMPFDEDFITAMEYGMPQQAGIGISVDRLTMLVTDTDHIRHVIYFPLLRPRRT
ncbi:lysine--tRNA ligase [Candidatus Daviesbacteria bacterium]|nr:lysine--tRNA ligase [Candidatus Daviesbacteria bacterium]